MIIASCHCGAVRLEIAAAPREVTDCNCSICRRLGVLWAYYSPGQVRLLGKPNATFAYIREGGNTNFHHCPTCGCASHWRRLDLASDRMGVNARLMDADVLAAARVRHLDGAVTEKYVD